MSGRQMPLIIHTVDTDSFADAGDNLDGIPEDVPQETNIPDDTWLDDVVKTGSPALQQCMREIKSYCLFAPGEERACFRKLQMHHDALLNSPITCRALKQTGVIAPEPDERVQWQMLHDIAAYLRERSATRGCAAGSDITSTAESCREWRLHYEAADPIRREIVTRNMRFVAAMAHQFQGRGLPVLDLIQEGCLGLMHAVDKLDLDRDTVLLTYATWWVRQRMLQAIRANHVINLPLYLVERMKKIWEARHALTGRLGSPPTDQEIAEHLGLQVLQVQRAIRGSSLQMVELDRPARPDGDRTIGDLLPDTGARDQAREAILREMPRWMTLYVQSLSERARFVMEMRGHIGDGRQHSLQEIGNILHLSRERVRQIERAALNKGKRYHRLYGDPL